MQESAKNSNELFAEFHSMIGRIFYDTLGLSDQELNTYLAGMLTDFAHFDNVYKITDMLGMPLNQVADMLEQADLTFNGASFDRERRVHKHIGDYTLFWTGIYPESLTILQGRCEKDHLIDYVQQGKASYYIASTFSHGDYAAEARILRCLSHTFETVAAGLHAVREAWERRSSPGWN